MLRHLFASFLLAALGAAASESVSFQRDIRPILAERCQVCHQANNSSGKLSLASYQSLMAGGQSGPVIVPGHPDRSPLIEAVSGAKPKMPKAGPPLSADQINLLRRWIEQGAKDDTPGGAGEDIWWSLGPLKSQPPPALGGSWVRTPVDAFILSKLREKNLTPSPEADRRTLIRRLTLDLHGLPPTAEEVEAFVADTAPDAYERLLDRLLASPRYGERWARHWLDVVHYGDSHGYDKDKPRPNAWPYRDYVIRALNEDKPYRRFVEEQLAGDVLFPEDPQGIVATGFIAAGPWDFVGHQELREGTTDKNTTRVLDRDDMVAATMSTFTSLTVHCARCHDHKFDPISQEDYYSLQAVFAGVDRADRPWHPDPTVNLRLQELLRRKQALQIKLQPLLDEVELASSREITELDNRIQDARAQLVHLGAPKTQADVELKKQLEMRIVLDRKRRQQLVDAIVGAETYAAIERLKAQITPLDQELQKFSNLEHVYAATSFFTKVGNFRPALQPRPVHLLARGNVQSPLKPVGPGAVSCVHELPSRFALPDPGDEGSRRAALARWITDAKNPLTWRSIVNRVWHYHFGAGIVDTPNDFGRMGSRPTHPELLDWLAVWFRDQAGGSLKQLHRLLLSSAVYRQSSRQREHGARIDSENRFLWRMNRSRLDAESLRDSVLAVAGKLDLTMGGPAVRMFYFKDDHSPVYDYSRFDPDAPGAHRRAIYRFIVRSAPDPFMDRLDCPDASLLAAKRSVTITAIQALAVLNNPFMVRMSQHFAARVRSAAPEITGQVSEAVRLALGRRPVAEEVQVYADYAKRYGLENLCRLLFNTNEFLFID